VCIKYVIDHVTMFSDSVQTCQYVPYAVFLCAFQRLIYLKREVIKLDLIRKHGQLVIRYWIF
jgi:hypothetical protein